MWKESSVINRHDEERVFEGVSNRLLLWSNSDSSDRGGPRSFVPELSQNKVQGISTDAASNVEVPTSDSPTVMLSSILSKLVAASSALFKLLIFEIVGSRTPACRLSLTSPLIKSSPYIIKPRLGSPTRAFWAALW